MRLTTLPGLALALVLGATSLPALSANDCRVVLDAGSSGTRLYVFEKQGTAWVEHEGPKVSALADPVRERRGRTWKDADAVVAEVAATLDGITTDGPLDKGKPRWAGFDWRTHCNVRSASAYATAGMRIAEQEDAERAGQLWGKLKAALQARLGAGVAVQARTLSGFEEGLFAWLTLNLKGKGTDFGVVEMGGASVQVIFPCKGCAEAIPVAVGGSTIDLFGHSFLGLGTDEAPKTVGATATTACALEAGKPAADKASQCGSAFKLSGTSGVFDPYNYAPSKARGTEKALPKEAGGVVTWYTTGAFARFKASDVETCCARGNTCFQPAAACFRSVYFQKFFDTVGVKAPQPSDTSWTLGAVACDENQCLAKAPPRECHWLKDRCLVN